MESERTIDGFKAMERDELISELCDTRAALRGRNGEIEALEAEIARLCAVLERADDMANALVAYFNKRGADHAMWKGNEDIGDLADALSNYGPLRLAEMDARRAGQGGNDEHTD